MSNKPSFPFRGLVRRMLYILSLQKLPDEAGGGGVLPVIRNTAFAVGQILSRREKSDSANADILRMSTGVLTPRKRKIPARFGQDFLAFSR